ncbi:MAG: insulinase family protein [Clostridiales bacterium]|jgi:Zn-dependent M16 (insulinase) family peptidase|nr:insulinase family protein [Clostridiales bacterium]
MPHNFTLTETQTLTEISTEAFLYTHKSGAQLLHLKNDDKNRVFAIAFKTPAANNTGVFHVLEHCVLGGSKKYPLRDMCNELGKGTLCTYINAITYRDKTLYPVAGTNEKELFKMADVYLDAVFNPLITEKKEIMLQEGVNFSIDENGNVTGYGGIVFNEMCGTFSAPVYCLGTTANAELYKGSRYVFDGGGKPEDIPKLTYKYLKKCYKKYYTPANAYFYLFGDLDAEKYLNHIDNEYLSKCKKRGRSIKTPKVKRRSGLSDLTVPVNSNDEVTIIMFSTNLKNSPFNSMALSVILSYLFLYESSPVRRALVDENLCGSVDFSLGFHIPELMASVTVSNCPNPLKAKNRVFEVLENVYSSGFDGELLELMYELSEFNIREANFGNRAKGVQYLMEISSSWLYGGSAFAHNWKLRDLLELKNNPNILRGLLRDVFLKNKYTLTAFTAEKPHSAHFKAYKATGEMLRENKKLREHLNKSEDEKALSVIPVIPLSDIEKFAEKIPFDVDRVLRISRTILPTDGITYLTFMFDINEFTPYFENYCILMKLLGKINTKNYSFEALEKKIGMNLGGQWFECWVHDSVTDESYNSTFNVIVKVLDKNIEKAFELTREIILNTLFGDIGRIEALLRQSMVGLKESFITEGSSWAINYASAFLRPSYKFAETTGGFVFYDNLLKMTDTEKLCEELKILQKSLFTKKNFSFHYTASAPGLEKQISDFYESLPDLGPDIQKPQTIDFLAGYAKNCRFVTETPVHYNAMALNFCAGGAKFHGSMNVLRNIIASELLAQKIRLEGGAYGYGMSLCSQGIAYLHSYRDPNVDKTYEVFKSISRFTENLNLSDKQLSRFIIGVINGEDSPKHVYYKGITALRDYLSNKTYEDYQREREEILAATNAKLRSLSEAFVVTDSNSSICTFGNGEIKSDLFTGGEVKITC